MHKKLSILSYEHPFESLALRALVLTLAVVSSLYLYFVAATVLNIIAQREATSNAAGVQTSIAQLEQQYFSLADSVTPHEAAQYGLTPIKETSYVYKPGNDAAAALPSDSVII